MDQLSKEELIDKIKYLISSDGTKIDINPDYLDYFEFEELEEIYLSLLEKKELQKLQMGDYLDSIYEKCT